LRRGIALITDKNSADAVIDVRAGALSTDEHSVYLGTPEFPLPVVSGLTSQPIVIPSLSMFKRAEAKATAKFAATGYDPKTGRLVVVADPQIGNSHKIDWLSLFFISWTNEDYLPPGADQSVIATRRAASGASLTRRRSLAL
jgi:hypothetical protein